MPFRRTGPWLRFGSLFAGLVVAVLWGWAASAQTAVTTYHYDNYRTGWNSQETVLTPANVNDDSFGMLYSVTLDEQVDAQPLFVPAVNITAGNYQGVHDVVYVVTERNSVYAIDSHTGTVLLSPHFGAPVPKPLLCRENSTVVGANSTPVIDTTSNTLYVIFYVKRPANGFSHFIHALDLGSLTDKVAPQRVAASHMRTDGTTFTFNSEYQRQRPGLLLANGNIYAGFGSFCDDQPGLSRGWLLGWTAGSLTPLSTNLLVDTLAAAPTDFYLSSIWMSGSAPATDDSGNILVVTGNSDPSGTTYDGVTNIQESVIKMSPDLTTVLDLFTPSDQPDLDQEDKDFGSGGVMVLPDQLGSIPHLAVAAGKEGNLYLMNEDALGGFSATENNVLGTYAIGGCWCAESYYVDGRDGAARIVASGGRIVSLWMLQTSPSPSLTQISVSPSTTTGQDPGFLTSVSSNGTSDPIIWAVSRPNRNDHHVYLYAFNPKPRHSTMQRIFRGEAGIWPYFGNANIVPVVANGQVYVASNRLLEVFGLTPEKNGKKKRLQGNGVRHGR